MCQWRDMKSSHLTEKVMVLTPASVQAATANRTRMHFIAADSSKLPVRPTHKAALLFGARQDKIRQEMSEGWRSVGRGYPAL